MASFPVRSDGRRPIRYRIVAGTTRLILRLWFGRKLDLGGLRELKSGAPLIVACNHLSNLDPLILGGFYPQTLFAMAKIELFRNPVVAWFLKGCNVMPVDRYHADRKALRIALELLKSQRLMIFVEGTRSETPGMRKAEPGVGFLARKSGADVLPVAVWNTERAWRRGSKRIRRERVHLIVGQSVAASELIKETDQGTADAIAQRVAELLPEEYRGVYA